MVDKTSFVLDISVGNIWLKNFRFCGFFNVQGPKFSNGSCEKQQKQLFWQSWSIFWLQRWKTIYRIRVQKVNLLCQSLTRLIQLQKVRLLHQILKSWKDKIHLNEYIRFPEYIWANFSPLNEIEQNESVCIFRDFTHGKWFSSACQAENDF